MFVHHDAVLTTWKERERELERSNKLQREFGPGTPEDSASVIRQTVVVLVLMVLALIGGSIVA
jgi:hypothetical protein